LIVNGIERHDQHSLCLSDNAGRMTATVYAEWRSSRTASGWADGKNPYQATAIKNTEERQEVSEVRQRPPMQTSEALPILGVPPLPLGARRSAQPLAGHLDGLSKLFMLLYGLQVRNIL